jgi:hypothetical protein
MRIRVSRITQTLGKLTLFSPAAFEQHSFDRTAGSNELAVSLRTVV